MRLGSKMENMCKRTKFLRTYVFTKIFHVNSFEFYYVPFEVYGNICECQGIFCKNLSTVT